ncbi:MAG: hypothetical protein V4772_08640 [Pseudomonadota bacterium]
MKSIISSDDIPPGFEAPPEFRAAGIEIDDIETVSAKDLPRVLETEKFMNEMVLIEIDQDAEDANAPVFVYIGHNGITQYIKRGEPQAVKRKFLYSALAAKRVRIACAFGKDGSGNEFNRTTPNASTTYRVHLVQDNNPQGGMKWAQSVMRAAA